MIPRITTTELTIVAKSKSLVTEASDLQWHVGESAPKIEVLNPATGNIVTFETYGVVVDSERDIIKWTYRPLQTSLNDHPAMKGWLLEVYND